MPTIDLSDEELQGLIHICATGSGPGVNWMLTNAILTKAQTAVARNKPPDIFPPPAQAESDGLDIAQTRIRASDEPPAFTGKGARR